jgi:hypothetical protein
MTGSILVLTEAGGDGLIGRPVMVSILRNGVVEHQSEVPLNGSAGSSNLPAGLYDVRIEGEGLQTLVKRGIHVVEGRGTNVIGGPIRTGEGIRIIEYAVGCLSREEMTARLEGLQTDIKMPCQEVAHSCEEVVLHLETLALAVAHLQRALQPKH